MTEYPLLPGRDALCEEFYKRFSSWLARECAGTCLSLHLEFGRTVAADLCAADAGVGSAQVCQVGHWPVAMTKADGKEGMSRVVSTEWVKRET